MLIYPYELDTNVGYPTHCDFSVRNNNEGKGIGVYTKKAHKRGHLVAKFSGNVVSNVMQHTLQINQATHLHDPYFSGLLLHSCSPNVSLDMQDFTIWAVRDIEPGEALTMDYATTEDHLYRQFECLCNSDNCRHWISGRKEAVNHQGEECLKRFSDKENIVQIRRTG